MKAAELMALDFTPVLEDRAWLLRLVDEGTCTPACLFATEGPTCLCRCGGSFHGEMRR